MRPHVHASSALLLCMTSSVLSATCSFYSNDIGAEGMAAIGEALQNNMTLAELW